MVSVKIGMEVIQASGIEVAWSRTRRRRSGSRACSVGEEIRRRRHSSHFRMERGMDLAKGTSMDFDKYGEDSPVFDGFRKWFD